MKRFTKLAIALTAAVSLAVVGCKVDEDEHGIIQGSVGSGNTEYTNDSEIIHRGFISTRTNHEGGTIKLTFNSTDNAGNVGYMFNLTENDDKTYNFCVATVKVDGGKVQTYVSYYKNVYTKDGNLDGDGNFKDINGNVISETATQAGAVEKQLIPTSGVWATLKNSADCKNSDGSYTLYINANMKEASGEQYSDNDVVYDVSFFTPKDVQGLTDDKIKEYTKAESLVSEAGASVVQSFKAKDCEMTGVKSKEQRRVGIYTLVRPGKTLEASWVSYDVKAQEEITGADDVIYE